MGELEGAACVPQSWVEAVTQLGIAGAVAMLEDQASFLCEAMLGERVALEKHVYQGLPVLLPVAAKVVMYEVCAPGEADGLALCALLAGLAITAHAAEYLYFGSNPRFATAQKIRAYKYLVQSEALRCAGQLSPDQLADYEELLGLSW